MQLLQKEDIQCYSYNQLQPILSALFIPQRGISLQKSKASKVEGEDTITWERDRGSGERERMKERRENHIAMFYNCFLINVSVSAKSLINLYSSHSCLANTANSRCPVEPISG
jgi:hypothetical protein